MAANSNTDLSAEDTARSLALCRLICTFPRTLFFLFTCIHAAAFVVTIHLYSNGYDVLPVYFETLPLYVYNDAHLKELSWMSKTQYKGRVHRPQNTRGDWETRSNIGDVVEVLYEHPHAGNLLETQSIKRLRKIEDTLFQDPEYQSTFCQLGRQGCVKPSSILRLFDGTFSHLDDIFNDTHLANVKEVLLKATFYQETSEFLEHFIGKNSDVSENASFSHITRSFFPMGWPLGRMKSGYYGIKAHLEQFLTGRFKAALEDINSNNEGGISVLYFSNMMHEHDVVQQAVKDSKLAIGSLVFIFVFMCVQTRSVFITTFGIISIVSSFLLTNFIYRYLLGYVYFGFFHLVSMFLILGIGADDLFIFHDTWRLHIYGNSLKSLPTILSSVYLNAAKTTFVTSLTTMTAFLVSGFSPLLPIKTFGIFSGILVAINYMLVLTFFPVLLVFHHTVVLTMFDRIVNIVSKTFKRSKQTERDTAVSKYKELGEHSKTGETVQSDSYIMTEKTNANRELSGIEIKSDNVESEATGRCIRSDHVFIIFHTTGKKPGSANIDSQTRSSTTGLHKKLIDVFFSFTTNKYVGMLIPILLLGVSAFFAHRISMLEPDSQEIRLFKNSHNYARASALHHSYFRRNYEADNQRLYLVWGMAPADISECNQQTADYCPGRPQWDEEFDYGDELTQSAMAKLCHKLNTLDVSLAAKLRIAQNTDSGGYKIACFTDAMDKFYQKELLPTTNGVGRYPDGLNLTVPVNPDNVTLFMEANRHLYPDIEAGRSRPFETLVSYWLSNGYSEEVSSDFTMYNMLLGEQRIPNVTQEIPDKYDHYYGTRLQYIAIEVNTTMNVYSVGYQEGMDVYNSWNLFLEDINAEMPPALSRGIHVTQNLWHWVHVKQILATSAITGILVGLCSAWPILVLTTFNYIIGTLAVVTIGLVTACVVGMIPLFGWKLGVLESINLCIVVGLSVDYIVHMAEAYRASKSPRRMEKVRDMLESIGLSVVSGAFTTIGAAVFMLFAQIQFIYQFGIFIIATVGTSLVFSLLGFTAILAYCGPEGANGALDQVLCCRSRRSKKFSLSQRV